jgi:hypothetical protein
MIHGRDPLERNKKNKIKLTGGAGGYFLCVSRPSKAGLRSKENGKKHKANDKGAGRYVSG